MTCDTLILNHKNFILSQLAYNILENLSHYLLIKIFTLFYDHFLARLVLLSIILSILEDKGHARNELWDIVYQIANFRLYRLSIFR